MKSRELKLGGGGRGPEAPAGDAMRAFKSVEDMVRGAFRAVVEQVLAETNDYGESFWDFPYTQPAGSLGSPHAHGTLLSEKAHETSPQLINEAKENLESTYDQFLKAGRAIPNDFTRLKELMGAGEINVKNTWFLPIKEKRLSEEVIAYFLLEMGWVFEEALDFEQDDVKYLALCAACALCGEKSLRPKLREKPASKPARRPSSIRCEKLVLPNDAITKALFGRGENHLTPADYMSGRPREIKTGKNLSATILIENDFDVTEACEAYQLNDVDRFWLESLCSLAKEGHLFISGRDLLKVNGFANPRSSSMRATMKEAFDSILKAARTWVTIDTSGEERAYAKSLGTALDEGIVLKQVVRADFSLMKFTDGKADFAVKLIPSDPNDPLSALPLAKYASNKRQLIDASTDDFVFESTKRCTFEYKRMWRYVVRRISEKGTSNTILCETMLKELGLENATKQKRSKLLNVLEEMLNERIADKARLSELSKKEESGALSKKEREKLAALRRRKLVKSYKVSRKGRVKHSFTIDFW